MCYRLEEMELDTGFIIIYDMQVYQQKKLFHDQCQMYLSTKSIIWDIIIDVQYHMFQFTQRTEQIHSSIFPGSDLHYFPTSDPNNYPSYATPFSPSPQLSLNPSPDPINICNNNDSINHSIKLIQRPRKYPPPDNNSTVPPTFVYMKSNGEKSTKPPLWKQSKVPLIDKNGEQHYNDNDNPITIIAWDPKGLHSTVLLSNPDEDGEIKQA